MDKESLDRTYLDMHTALEAEYYDVIPDGKGQRLVLKEGKSLNEFNISHADLWKNHEAESIANGFMEPKVELEPSFSTHVSQLVSVDVSKVRPAQVKRMWEEREYFYDCFVTETIKDMYVAGNLQIGDWVLVFFDDRGEQLVTEKIYKSW